MGGIKKFLDPPKLYYLQTKHKKLIFSATIHLTRKRFIFPGRYLNHFGKKLDMGGGSFKNAEGVGLKTMNVKPNLQTLDFHKALRE